MQRSYLVKSPINFADFGFFVRVGDLLVHDPLNHNKLTVYRNGEIVKSITQTPLGVAALLKNGFISEVNTPVAAPKAPLVPKKGPPSLVAKPPVVVVATPKPPVVVKPPEPEMKKAKAASTSGNGVEEKVTKTPVVEP